MQLHVIEWKTSTKKKLHVSHCYTYPSQVAAYLVALQNDPRYSGFREARGLVVILNCDGEDANVHIVGENNLAHHWGRFKKSLDLY